MFGLVLPAGRAVNGVPPSAPIGGVAGPVAPGVAVGPDGICVLRSGGSPSPVGKPAAPITGWAGPWAEPMSMASPKAATEPSDPASQ